jgi:hypothetical protein
VNILTEDQGQETTDRRRGQEAIGVIPRSENQRQETIDKTPLNLYKGVEVIDKSRGTKSQGQFQRQETETRDGGDGRNEVRKILKRDLKKGEQYSSTVGLIYIHM